MRISDWSSDVCSSDLRARALAKRLDNAPLAIVDKRRERAGESEVMNIIGDVSGRFCILIDDIVDSAGTLCNAAAALKAAGAEGVVAYCTHGVLSGGAVARVRSDEHTSELQSLMRISYAVFCLKKKKNKQTKRITQTYILTK